MRHRWMETGLDPFLSYPGPVHFAVVARSNRREECARRCIIANAVVAHWKETPNVHYSRSNTYYAQLNSSIPDWFSRRMIARAVKDPAEAGLLKLQTTRPSPRADQRSRFWATPKLRSFNPRP